MKQSSCNAFYTVEQNSGKSIKYLNQKESRVKTVTLIMSEYEIAGGGCGT